METLVVTPQHRNEYYGKISSQIHGMIGSPTGGFRDISCGFQAREGILPTPLKYCYGSSESKKVSSPKTPSPVGSHRERVKGKHLKNNGKSNAIPINLRASSLEKSFSDDLSYVELWAGPTYSNSPPPSSLPIPKFSLRQKRSVSLELPEREFGLKIHPLAKSAPSSPRGVSCPSPDSFFHSTATATKDLRRILNLDIGDE